MASSCGEVVPRRRDACVGQASGHPGSRLGDLSDIARCGAAVSPDERVFKPDANIDADGQTRVDGRPVGAGITVPQSRPLEHRDAGIDRSGELDCGSIVVLEDHLDGHPVNGAIAWAPRVQMH